MVDVKMAEWWQAVPAWIAAGGPQKSRRWLKQFRHFCEDQDLGEVDSGFHVAYALDEYVGAWQEADEGERARVTDGETFRELRMAFREGRLAAQRARQQAQADQAAAFAVEASQRRWTLIAGENSRVIGSGTLDEVRALYGESQIPLRPIAAVIVTCDSGERREWQVQGPRLIHTRQSMEFVHDVDCWPGE